TKAGRNNAIFTLSLACYQSKISIKETLDMMDQFNSNLDQPLDHVEVRGIVMSAYSGKYQAAHKDYIDRLLQTYATPGQVN
ncbi:primase C-terminal domain-containing protein, partial [Bacillus cereus]|uniref:primase C-terminal domain-containing protein n=2 Tax=Bacillaceae TaxID=186817 RepID=UPI000BFAD633